MNLCIYGKPLLTKLEHEFIYEINWSFTFALTKNKKQEFGEKLKFLMSLHNQTLRRQLPTKAILSTIMKLQHVFPFLP